MSENVKANKREIEREREREREEREREREREGGRRGERDREFQQVYTFVRIQINLPEYTLYFDQHSLKVYKKCKVYFSTAANNHREAHAPKFSVRWSVLLLKMAAMNLSCPTSFNTIHKFQYVQGQIHCVSLMIFIAPLFRSITDLPTYIPT